MIEKAEQESEEYLKWKQGSVSVEEPPKPTIPESATEEILKDAESFRDSLLSKSVYSRFFSLWYVLHLHSRSSFNDTDIMIIPFGYKLT